MRKQVLECEGCVEPAIPAQIMHSNDRDSANVGLGGLVCLKPSVLFFSSEQAFIFHCVLLLFVSSLIRLPPAIKRYVPAHAVQLERRVFTRLSRLAWLVGDALLKKRFPLTSSVSDNFRTERAVGKSLPMASCC